MLIELQFAEASELLHDLLQCLPKSLQVQFADRVNRVSSLLHHPSLGGAVICSVGGDSTHEPPIAFGDVVLPLEECSWTSPF